MVRAERRWFAAEAAETPVKDGRVLQVIGAVVDVEVRSESRSVRCLMIVVAAMLRSEWDIKGGHGLLGWSARGDDRGRRHLPCLVRTVI